MGLTVTIKPKFSAKKIYNETIQADWNLFQYHAFAMGKVILFAMHSYINSHRKRKGGTGNLAKAIKFYSGGTFGGQISWGVGKISEMQKAVPYWYVVNYGKMVTGKPYIPYHGKRIPGDFEGSRPNANTAGAGNQRFYKRKGSFSMKPGKSIRPMHYIEYGQLRLSLAIKEILKTLKTRRI